MLAILTTHPIQYQVPLWKALAEAANVPFEVWYMSDHGTRPSYDTEFKQTFSWDLDMLAGYPSRFLKVNSNHDVARFGRLRLQDSLGDLLREKEVRALWIQGWHVAAYWQAVWQARAAGVPVWLRGESNDLSVTSPWKKPIKRFALKQLFDQISAFLYIGKANRRLYERYGVRPEQLYPAPYCVDNDRFAKQAEDLKPRRAELRRAWGIPEDSFCILFAGKFIPKKRPLDIVAAVSHLRHTNPDRRLHLLFAGSGEMGSALRQACTVVLDAETEAPSTLSSSDGDKPAASFTGFLNQTEISKAYVAADCLVLPSDHQETWGLVVNEAMASGLPCIVSDACGCAEDLVDSDLTFSLGSTSELACALLSVMSRMISPTDLIDRVSRFDLSASVATCEQVYRHAL